MRTAFLNTNLLMYLAYARKLALSKGDHTRDSSLCVVVTGYVGLYESREATLIGLGAASLLYGVSAIAPGLNLDIKFDVDLKNGVILQTGKEYEGLTLGHMVFYSSGPDQTSYLQHEMTHVPRWGAFGSQGFWSSYTNQVGVLGYEKAPFEAEAYSYKP